MFVTPETPEGEWFYLYGLGWVNTHIPVVSTKEDRFPEGVSAPYSHW